MFPRGPEVFGAHTGQAGFCPGPHRPRQDSCPHKGPGDLGPMMARQIPDPAQASVVSLFLTGPGILGPTHTTPGLRPLGLVSMLAKQGPYSLHR